MASFEKDVQPCQKESSLTTVTTVNFQGGFSGRLCLVSGQCPKFDFSLSKKLHMDWAFLQMTFCSTRTKEDVVHLWRRKDI